MEKLPEFHQPQHLRSAKTPPVTVPIMYGHGIEHTPGEFGMVFGPTSDLEEVLEQEGQDTRDAIVRFNKDQTDTILYRWDSKKEGWRKV